MDKEIKNDNLNNTAETAEEGHGLTADKIAHLLEHLGDEVIRDMLDSAGLDYDDPLGENEADDESAEDEAAGEEYVGKRFRREAAEAEEAEEAESPEEAPETVETQEAEETKVSPETVNAEVAEKTKVSPEAVGEVGSETKAPVEAAVIDEPEKTGALEVPDEHEETKGSAPTADMTGSDPEGAENSENTEEKDGDGSESSEEKVGAGSGTEKTGPDSKPEGDNSEAGVKDEDESSGSDPKDKKKGRKISLRKGKSHRKVPLIRRLLFVFVLIGVLLLPLAVHFIYISATLNSDDPIQYSEHVDEISCTDGVLKVNNINVAVPTDGTEEYSISYAWSEEDEKYPSVPHAITAIYKGAEGARKYSVSLYRNETVPTAEIPQGKSADNWFDDWQATEDDEQTVQTQLQFDNVKGFYISPKPNPDDPEVPPEYDNYSFYFAVQDADGVSIYVLEGVCIDEQYHKEFAEVMDTCIQSIAIKVPGSEQS